MALRAGQNTAQLANGALKFLLTWKSVANTGYKVGLRANTKTLRRCTVYIHTHMKHARQHFATFLSSTFCSDAKWLLCASLLFISGTSEQMFLNTTQQHGNRQRKWSGGSLQFTVVMYPPIHAAWANCMSLGRRARLLKYSWELTNKCVRRVQFFSRTLLSQPIGVASFRRV